MNSLIKGTTSKQQLRGLSACERTRRKPEEGTGPSTSSESPALILMPICNSAAVVRTSKKSHQRFRARTQLPLFYPEHIVITLTLTLKFCTKHPGYSVQGQHEINPLYLMKHGNSQFFSTSLRGQTLRQPNEIACVEQPTVTCS